MLSKSFEKLQESEELRAEFAIKIDKRDLDDLKNDTEVVYKPTTMNAGKFEKFQSLQPENSPNSKDSAFLYRTAFFGNLLAFTAGLGFSWTSPVLPKLHGPNSPLKTPIDASQESVIAAILCVGASIGPFLFGYLADKIGRKKTLLAIALPMTVSLLILAYTDEVKMYYLARLLFGTASGGVFTVLTMYTGEITENTNRGKFSCILGIFVAMGVLYPFAVGPLLSVQTFCLSCLLPVQVFLIFFAIYAPESPPYLLRIGQVKQAERALMRLQDKSRDQVQKPLMELQQVVQREQNEKGGVRELFKVRGTRNAFVVGAGLLIIQQVSGINAIMGFLEPIFAATGSAIPPHIATIIIGVIQVLSVVVTSSLVERLGRKLLLLSSALGGAASITLLGLYFFLRKQNFALLSYFWWLPIVCVVLYIISFNLGIGPVPWTVLTEIFPNNVKSSATALASATCFGTSFVITMAFPIVSELLGMEQCFWIFGGCCVLGAVFIFYFVPETKGRTLAEIQEILGK